MIIAGLWRYDDWRRGHGLQCCSIYLCLLSSISITLYHHFIDMQMHASEKN